MESKELAALQQEFEAAKYIASHEEPFYCGALLQFIYSQNKSREWSEDWKDYLPNRELMLLVQKLFNRYKENGLFNLKIKSTNALYVVPNWENLLKFIEDTEVRHKVLTLRQKRYKSKSISKYNYWFPDQDFRATDVLQKIPLRLNMVMDLPLNFNKDIKADEITEDNPVWFNYQYMLNVVEENKALQQKTVFTRWSLDSRGRMYSLDAFHFQSVNFFRASFEAYHKEIIEPKNMKFVWLDLANQCGYKDHPDSRIIHIKLLVANKGYSEAIKRAAEEGNEYSAYKIIQILENPSEPTGWLVGLDATASGIAMLSLLTADRKGLYNTNHIGNVTNEWRDPYEAVAKPLKLKRKNVKKAIMTVFYGSVATPIKHLGSNAMNLLFNKVIPKLAPKVLPLVKNCSRIIDKSRAFNRLLRPDGKMVYIPNHTGIERTFMVKHAFKNYRIKTMLNVPMPILGYTPGGMMPHIAHMLDAYVAQQVVLNTEDTLPVHDCFYNHPNQLDSVLEAYRDACAEILLAQDGKYLENLLNTINPKLPQTILNTYDYKEAKKLAKEVKKQYWIIS